MPERSAVAIYTVEDLCISEPDPNAEPGTQARKKTISVTVRCDGYEADAIRVAAYGDTLAPMGRSEVDFTYIYLTIPFSADPRTVAKSIKEEIAKRKVDRTQSKLLLGQVMELGASAVNP